jgi:hypothetical protein
MEVKEMTADDRHASTEVTRPLPIGCGVEVRTRYLGGWSHGFEVAQHVDRGCRIRRSSDGSVFDDVFEWADIRPSASVDVRRSPSVRNVA